MTRERGRLSFSFSLWKIEEGIRYTFARAPGELAPFLLSSSSSSSLSLIANGRAASAPTGRPLGRPQEGAVPRPHPRRRRRGVWHGGRRRRDLARTQGRQEQPRRGQAARELRGTERSEGGREERGAVMFFLPHQIGGQRRKESFSPIASLFLPPFFSLACLRVLSFLHSRLVGASICFSLELKKVQKGKKQKARRGAKPRQRTIDSRRRRQQRRRRRQRRWALPLSTPLLSLSGETRP